jgi:hypothetical protein
MFSLGAFVGSVRTRLTAAAATGSTQFKRGAAEVGTAACADGRDAGVQAKSFAQFDFHSLVSLPRGRHDHGVAIINGTHLVVYGGQFGHKEAAAWEVQAFKVPSPTTPRSSTASAPATATASCETPVWVPLDSAGRTKPAVGATSVPHLANPSTQPPPCGSFGAAALVGGDGSVVVGGYGEDGNVDTAHIFRPALGPADEAGPAWITLDQVGDVPCIRSGGTLAAAAAKPPASTADQTHTQMPPHPHQYTYYYYGGYGDAGPLSELHALTLADDAGSSACRSDALTTAAWREIRCVLRGCGLVLR